jgi:gliding motility-associated-like protein
MKKPITLLFLILSVFVYSENSLDKHKNLPPALVLSYTLTNPTCPGLNNGAINGTVTGGSLPYSNFSLTNGTTVLTSATGTFLNLAPGTYTLSVSDAFSTVSQTGIIIIAPTDLSISLPRTICAGTPTNLSVSGSTTGFLWSANPADTSLNATNNTSATPTVSPNATTTYTVTSTSNSPSPNMVTNGDFSQGNLGFSSDYLYIANAGTSGVQRAYGVVTAATSWFQFFPSCNIEHTTGTGKMMIIDGSTINAGNDKVWGQTITVQPNQTYTFSYWIQTVSLPNPANIEVKINGVVVGTDLAPSAECSWSLRTYTWNSGTATSAQIAMYDKVVAAGGNDFALDDISFTTNVVCSLSKTVVITVTPRITPTFNSVNPICAGEVLSALPTTSNNSITGTWSPALNNSATTTYTFAPATGQCAANGTLTITVSPIVSPTFTAVNPICSGATLSALPTISNNSITGTWSPALNNLATTTYTFSPLTGQCATNGSMSITVNPNVTPTFTQVPTICSGAALSVLPTVSNNAISGNWSPVLNNSATTIYTFTPSIGQCSSNATLTITVTPFPQFSITGGCNGTDFELSAIGIGTTNATFTWYNNLHQNIGNTSSITIINEGNYSLELSNNGCSEEKPITVANILCSIPKGISPNGDGDNDIFDLSNLNVQRLQIFNRYGIEVYSKRDYTNEWVGKSNSREELPDGTYYFVVTFPNGKTKTGWVYINK